MTEATSHSTAQYSTVYIYPIFFIHSSVDGYLGCFHILAIVNSSTRFLMTCVSLFTIEIPRIVPLSEDYYEDNELVLIYISYLDHCLAHNKLSIKKCVELLLFRI